MIDKTLYQQLITELRLKKVILVAVSKTKSTEDIKALYDLGQRDFGENYVQELAEKAEKLPKDIRWHFIGHLQTNKVKQIAAFIYLIQSVDSLKLLEEINRQAKKNNRVINCLLQMHIAQEETKFGLDEHELHELLNTNSGELHELKNVKVIGLMGMASLTEDMNKVRIEFNHLKAIFNKYAELGILSMGMSNDYKIAIEEGSTMIRIGSRLFGNRS